MITTIENVDCSSTTSPETSSATSPETPAETLAAPETTSPPHTPSSIPNPPSSPSEPSHLLDSLCTLLPRFVVLPKHAAETLALWIVHTYCFQFRDVSTYIGVGSPEKRCGKTTLLGVLSKLVHRPVVASNISPSAFFRVIEEMQPTLMIDEADTFLQGNDELRGILNAGYHKPSAYVIRVSNEARVSVGKSQPENSADAAGVGRSKRGDGSAVEDSRSEIEDARLETRVPSSISQLPSSTSLATYSTWCPKFIAAIGHLPETLADRCIVIRMERKREGHECERLRDLDSGIINHKSDIINSCLRFASENQAAIAKARPSIPKSLNDRAADIWEPLFVIADLAGGDWPEKARAAAVALTTGAQESSVSGSLLFDLAYLFHFIFKKPSVFSQEIIKYLNTDHFALRPWREARNGKPVTEIWLSRQLKPYGVRPKNIRDQGKVCKGYDLADLKPAFRYIPNSEIENLSAEVTRANASQGEK